MPFGLLQGVANIFTSRKANKELKKLLGQNPTYQRSIYPQQQLNLAQQLFGGRMFGAPQLERNIMTSGANFNAGVDRSATDSSQALALKAAGVGQTNADLGNLQVQEQQNKMNLLPFLSNAYGGMQAEDFRVYQDQIRKFQDTAAIKGAQQQNRAGMVNGIFNGLNSDFNDAMSIFGMFSGGGFGGAKKTG